MCDESMKRAERNPAQAPRAATPRVCPRLPAGHSAGRGTSDSEVQVVDPEFARAENEDDDG